jgi:late competence protein required for DNA uptake (superfamily II DNA/RNA helicase)
VEKKEEKEKIIEVPLKNQKPRHSHRGGSHGYRCPVCNGTGLKTKPTVCYGGTGCRFCECSGRIRKKDVWVYLKTQIVAERYKKKIGDRYIHYKIPQYYEFE